MVFNKIAVGSAIMALVNGVSVTMDIDEQAIAVAAGKVGERWTNWAD